MPMTDDKPGTPVINEDRTGTDSTMPAVIATPVQILPGHPVGTPPHPAVCTICGTRLGETEIVLAYAYQCRGSRLWNVPRLFCWGCAPDAISTPTFETAEVLVAGRVGALSLPTSRSHRLCLTELAVRAYSPPTEGAEP